MKMKFSKPSILTDAKKLQNPAGDYLVALIYYAHY
jgi:hypothetical protein